MPPEAGVVDAGTTSDTTSGTTPANGSGAVPEWVTQLPDETLRGDKTLARYADPIAAHRGLVEAHKALSTRAEGMVKVPGKDAKPEDVAAFRAAVGVPADVGGYKDVKIPEGAGIDPAGFEAYKAHALAQGLTPSQVQESLNFVAGWQAKQQEGLVKGWIAEHEALRNQWGPLNFEAYMGRAKRALPMALKAAGAGDGFVKVMTETGLEEHPDFLKLGKWMADHLLEGKFEHGDPGNAQTRTGIQEKINAIRGDAKHPWNQPNHPEHGRAVAEMENLYKALHGTDEIHAR